MSQHALVVEGGAMRGIFAADVLDAFLSAHYQPFNQCFGVSAGATNIAAYLCGQHKRNHAVITDYSCQPELLEQQLKASCAILIAYREHPKIGGIAMTDGGVADCIPVEKAFAMGAKEITVVLSQPLGYRKKLTKAPWLTKQLYKDHPALARASLARAENYNASIDFIHNPPSSGKINAITPPANFKVGRTTQNYHKLSAGFEMDVISGIEYLAAI